MKLLFIHPNMPGQYRHLAPAFANDPGNQVVFLTKNRPFDLPNIRKLEYKPPRDPSPFTHPYLIPFERAVIEGQECFRMCRELKQREGFTPDVIVAHPGWGSCLYIKDIYPDVPLLYFFEFYYSSHGADVNFDPDDPTTPNDDARIRSKNALHLFSLTDADWGLSPTRWQLSQFPEIFQPKISCLHDGIDVHAARPNNDPNLSATLPDGTVLRRDMEVITYIARNLEPYRGFPTFMRAAARLLKERPNLHIVAIGGDEVSYGKQPKGFKSYREQMLAEVKLSDPSRLHFVGRIPYPLLITLFQMAKAHIYLTYPFVLSWSLMEAMACEALIIASDTPPVTEVMEDGKNGLLTGFFNDAALAHRVTQALDNQEKYAPMRKAARQTILDHYALDKLLPQHKLLVEQVAARQFPPAIHQQIEGRRYGNAA